MSVYDAWKDNTIYRYPVTVYPLIAEKPLLSPWLEEGSLHGFKNQHFYSADLWVPKKKMQKQQSLNSYACCTSSSAEDRVEQCRFLVAGLSSSRHAFDES